MNKKSLCILLVISGLILVSLFVRNGRFLVLALPFLAYMLIGASQAPTDLSLVVKRVIAQPAVIPDEPVHNHLTVVNHGNCLVNLSLIDSNSKPFAILSGQTAKRILLSRTQTAELDYTFKAQRGVYTWKSIRAIASDSFGLFEVEKEIPAEGQLVVRPVSMNLIRIPIRPRYTLHSPGLNPVRLSGSSTDFLSVREYRAGDSLRRLNWRLAARHPHEMFSNEYEREEITDFGLILDARKLTGADSLEEKLFEHSVSATVSLSEAFLKQGNRVALLIFGRNMAALFPGYGKKQLKKIVWSLAQARLGSSLSLGYLEYFPTRLFPSRSFLIVLSTLGPQDEKTYARLRSFGYDVLLISPDPVHAISQELPPSRVNELAVRAARIERTIQLKNLIKLGVQVIDWNITEPFEKILRTATGPSARRQNV